MKKFSFMFTFIFCFASFSSYGQLKLNDNITNYLIATGYNSATEVKTAQERQQKIIHDKEVSESLTQSAFGKVLELDKDGISTSQESVSNNECTIKNYLSTNSSYFMKTCNQLDGAIIDTEEEGSEIFDLSRVFLNRSIDVLTVTGNQKECEKCFKKSIKDTESYTNNEAAIAKDMILSLKEKELTKEMYNLAGVMEGMAKQNAIRGSSIQYILSKDYTSNSAERKEQEDKLNCRSIKDITEKVNNKCPTKSINVEGVLSKVLPGNQDIKTGTFMDRLYSNASTLEVEKSICKSGLKSVGNYQKVQFLSASEEKDSAIFKANNSFHSIVDQIVSTVKAREALCGSNKVNPKLFIEKLISESIQKHNKNIQDLNIDITAAISPFVSEFNRVFDSNKTIDFEADEISRNELISEFLSLSVKADPINKIFLSDSKFLCDFAVSEHANKGIKNYLQLNNKNNEKIEDFHRRQFDIVKDYSSKSCQPVLDKISSLVCGEGLPDFADPKSSKEYLKDNFNSQDIKTESFIQFQKRSSFADLGPNQSEIPALAGLNCELNSSASMDKPIVSTPLAFIDKSFPNEDLKNSDFLNREMEKMSGGKNVDSNDDLVKYKGSQVCSDAVRTVEDINIESAIYGIEVDPDELLKTVTKQIIDNGYQGEMPKEIRESVARKRALTNNPVIASSDIPKKSNTRNITKSESIDFENKNALSEFAEKFKNVEDKEIQKNSGFSPLNPAYTPTIPDASDLTDVVAEDVAKVIGNPETLKDYNNWKQVKEKNEEALKKKIAELTKNLNKLKNESSSSAQEEEISSLEKEIAALDSSLKNSKAKKFATNNTQNSSVKQFKTAKQNSNDGRVQRANDNSGSNKFASSQQGGGGSSASPVKRSLDKSSSANKSGYLVLQSGSRDVSSLFTDKIKNDELGDIDVKYGANGLPLYVKIPGQTLYVAVNELSDAARELIFSSLSREDKVAIALKESKKENKLGRKLASVDDGGGDVSTLEGLNDVTNMKMLEFSRDLNDSRLVKFYLKRIKKMNPVMYELVKDNK
jgi:hypothetical protein